MRASPRISSSYPSVVHVFRRFSQGLVDDTLNLKFDHFPQIHFHFLSIPGAKIYRANPHLTSTERSLLLERQRVLFELQRLFRDGKGFSLEVKGWCRRPPWSLHLYECAPRGS